MINWIIFIVITGKKFNMPKMQKVTNSKDYWDILKKMKKTNRQIEKVILIFLKIF